ncbi:MAG: hypothetical protein SH809_05375 [Rhodothermales bacterium]|nr:hypothetical protein [Rhodothermales bacterium]
MSPKTYTIKWHRLSERLLWHHLPLAALSSIATALCYQWVASKDVIHNWSMATAYPCLALLAATLVTGPLMVLRGKRRPVSNDLTRDIGIWAGVLSFLHTIFGLQVHFRGRMWLLFVPDAPMAFPFLRLDLFGMANYTGVIAVLVVLMLLGLSNDWSLRRLGVSTWKRLQRWNYALFGLVVVHGILYQILEKRAFPFVVLFAAMGLCVIVLQVAGRRRVMRAIRGW